MGLASTLSTALTGLSGAETTFDVVGNNLANSNTVGFKESLVNFATQFLQTLSLGSAPTSNSGGTDPRQTGLGTMVAEITPSFNQGTVQISSIPTDLAIQGDGFFIVQGTNGEHLYTRNGEFKMNSANEIVTTTGNRLLGFGVNDQFQIQQTNLVPLTIPLGAAAVAQATNNVYLEGQLSPTGEIATKAERIRTDVLSDERYSAPDHNPDAAADASPVTHNLNGKYEYYVTFATAAGGPGHGFESRANLDLSPSTVNVTNGSVTLTNLPTVAAGDTSGWTVRRVYRCLATDESKFYYVGETADATSNVAFQDSTSDADLVADDAGLPNGGLIDLDGPKILSGTPLVDVLRRDGNTFVNVFQPGTLHFTGEKGDRTLATKDFTINDDIPATATTPAVAATTVQELIDFMSQAMGIQPTTADPNVPIPESETDVPGVLAAPGGTVDTQGRITLTGNNGVGNAIAIQLSGLSETYIDPIDGQSKTDTVNLPFNSFQSAVGESAITDTLVYDSLGIQVPLRITADLESRDNTGTTYRWFADSASNSPASGSAIAVGAGTITFDNRGNFKSADNSQVAIQREGFPSVKPLIFNLDFSKITGLAADQSSLAVSSQDGFAPGTLTSFIVGEDGKITGVFSNGASRDLGQIRLARFANPDGLEQKGQNLYAVGINSGLPIEGNPAARGIGTLVTGAVELSNSDIGGNLIELILASTMYRANARVITTDQQMLDELLALRR
jgi:flagellar hook protein FlgE